jgi:hypothetical protein
VDKEDLNTSNMPKDLMKNEPTEDVGEDNNGGLPKNLSFRDFVVVDYMPGMGEYINYQAIKRHKDTHSVGGPMGESVDVETEALSHSQRIKMGQRMRRMSKRIAIARKRALKRTPTSDVVKKRAMKSARKLILKKMTKGMDKGELSFARRQDLEKRLDRMKPRIQRIAKKLAPEIRKRDRDRKKSASQATTDKK